MIPGIQDPSDSMNVDRESRPLIVLHSIPSWLPQALTWLYRPGMAGMTGNTAILRQAWVRSFRLAERIPVVRLIHPVTKQRLGVCDRY